MSWATVLTPRGSGPLFDGPWPQRSACPLRPRFDEGVVDERHAQSLSVRQQRLEVVDGVAGEAVDGEVVRLVWWCGILVSRWRRGRT